MLKRIKNLIKSKPEPQEKENKAPEEEFKGYRKKPFNIQLPPWLKVDWFEKKDMGTMKPPDELVEELLNEKKGRQFESKKTSQRQEKTRKQLLEQKHESFLDDFLTTDKSDKKE
ncbi:MAG: hypothetical protein H7A32_01140 [Deltaproteobacteria bacterium]|nr:hypothetical protein [Deltaproteobacteria bacterium]